MTSVAYDRQTLNSPNPLARFAHRNRLAASLSMVSSLAPQGGVVVDFGAGQGAFLSALADLRPDLRLYAIEPHMAPAADGRLSYLQSLRELPHPADVISCLEVCEHLSDADLSAFLGDAAAMLAPGGRLLVSVPIMLGGALALKEINRSLLFRRRSEYSLRELLAATFGGTVERPANRLVTHKGFDFRELRGLLSGQFQIRRSFASPLPLPWWANSQMFFVCAVAENAPVAGSKAAPMSHQPVTRTERAG